MLVFVGLGAYTINATITARDRGAAARRAQQASDAYQQARFDVFAAETLARRYVSSPDPATRQEFDAAVDSVLRDFDSIGQLGTPAERQFANELVATEVPALRVVQDIFDALEAGRPYEGQLPDVSISTQIRAKLDELAQGRRQTSTALMAAESQAQSDRLQVTLVAYATGLALVAVLLVLARVLGNHDARRRTESAEKLRSLEARKLESLTVLAGGVAHDFNNLLVGIVGNTTLAMNDLPAESPARELIRDIETSARRAAELARQMLAYSGKGRFSVERVDINELVEQTSRLAMAATLSHATVAYDFADGTPKISGDATQLRQVIMNLVINASDAIGARGGAITVSTQAVHLNRGTLGGLSLGEGLPEGEYVCLEVTDTGSGMAPDVVSRIFEPFYTTKFSGRGLGLAAVMGIVRGHRGAIRVRSEVGAGTTFAIFLPCISGPAESVGEVLVDSPPEMEAKGTVLVVDDEPVVRVTVSRALRALGLRVLTATDGQEGVETFAQHQDDIACVLLDLTMPRMTGDEALRAIRAICPGSRIILMSGYDEQEVAERFAGDCPTAFLQKPFDFDTLAYAVGRTAMAASIAMAAAPS